jgi:hypothetical protein
MPAGFHRVRKPALPEGRALTEERGADAVAISMLANRRRRQPSSTAGQGETKPYSGYAQGKAGRAETGIALQTLRKRGAPGLRKNVVVIVVAR